MECKRIDMAEYPRRKHFELFYNMHYPYVGITCDVDVTELRAYCTRMGYSFYLTFMHLAALAGDDVPQMRHRIHDHGVVEYSECPTSHVELLEDETYCYCTLHHHKPLAEFIPYAEEQRVLARQRGTIEDDPESEGYYFISSSPWNHYNALIQPVAGGEDSNPRITWGRYQLDAKERLQLPVTLLVHHGLMDGIHIGRFYKALEQRIKDAVEGKL